MKIDSLKCQDASVRFFCFGAPEGQPLVIIPGVALKSVTESADLIAQQYMSAAENHRIIVIDRRSPVGEDCSIKILAQDVIDVLDSLSVKNADLYGVSQGGLIAQAVAVMRSGLVRKLVLCSTAAEIDENAAEILGQWRRLAERRDISGLMSSFAENVYSPAYCEKYREAFVEFGKTVSDEEMRDFAVMLGCMDCEDIRGKLGGLRCPVLVMAGDNDRIFDVNQAERLAELTNGELCIYKGQAHGVYDELPDVLGKIISFLEDD